MVWRVLCALQFYFLLIVYTYLGITPHPEKSIPVFNDWVMHFTGYVIAAISITFARPQWLSGQRAAFLILYSIAIEIAQYFNPPRTFSLTDILANSTGVLLGLVIMATLAKYVSPFANLLYRNISTAEKK